MSKVLILVPHGDDEVLGFGGVISKHIRNGDTVEVGFLSSHYNSRSLVQDQNIECAAAVLGYNNFHKLNVIAPNITEITLEGLTKIETFIKRISPDVLYLPHTTDVHQDHHLTIKLARIATRIHGESRVLKIFSGEIISSAHNGFAINDVFQPRYYMQLEEEDVIKKQKALQCYTEEIRPYPHPRSIEGIKIYAQKRGMECGVVYAEAFECLRHIEK